MEIKAEEARVQHAREWYGGISGTRMRVTLEAVLIQALLGVDTLQLTLIAVLMRNLTEIAVRRPFPSP